MENEKTPDIAIVDPNTLSVLGLKHLIESVMPVVNVDCYGSFAELESNAPDHYYHYFVELRVVLANMPFFLSRRQKTIVIAGSGNDAVNNEKFHTIYTNQPEKQLLRSLLALEQSAHAHGRNLPSMARASGEGVSARSQLSMREVEVMSLVAKGKMNKEIADMLNISIPTVVSHRKNIMTKLNMKTVSALTIYAVMHGYVSVDDV